MSKRSTGRSSRTGSGGACANETDRRDYATQRGQTRVWGLADALSVVIACSQGPATRAQPQAWLVPTAVPRAVRRCRGRRRARRVRRRRRRGAPLAGGGVLRPARPAWHAPCAGRRWGPWGGRGRSRLRMPGAALRLPPTPRRDCEAAGAAADATADAAGAAGARGRRQSGGSTRHRGRTCVAAAAGRCVRRWLGAGRSQWDSQSSSSSSRSEACPGCGSGGKLTGGRRGAVVAGLLLPRDPVELPEPLRCAGRAGGRHAA